MSRRNPESAVAAIILFRHFYYSYVRTNHGMLMLMLLRTYDIAAVWLPAGWVELLKSTRKGLHAAFYTQRFSDLNISPSPPRRYAIYTPGTRPAALYRAAGSASPLLLPTALVGLQFFTSNFGLQDSRSADQNHTSKSLVFQHFFRVYIKKCITNAEQRLLRSMIDT